MPNYRRAHVPGGSFFFTLKTEGNAPVFDSVMARTILGRVLRETKQRWPVDINAIVLLPDHMHTIWTLPRGDSDFSTRWAWLKKEFTRRYLKSGGVEQNTSESRKKNRRRGVWQRRFWERVLISEDDFRAYFDDIHWNPVKHGYVKCPRDWPASPLGDSRCLHTRLGLWFLDTSDDLPIERCRRITQTRRLRCADPPVNTHTVRKTPVVVKRPTRPARPIKKSDRIHLAVGRDIMW